jgi:hypothetical protein
MPNRIVDVLFHNFSYYGKNKETRVISMWVREEHTITQHLAEYVKNAGVAIYPDTEIFIIKRTIDAYRIHQLSQNPCEHSDSEYVDIDVKGREDEEFCTKCGNERKIR